MKQFRILTAGLLGVGMTTGALAQNFNSSASFLAAIQSNYYEDTFSGWAYGNPLGNASTGGTAAVTYTAPGNASFDWQAIGGTGVANAGQNLWSDPSALSTDQSDVSITFSFAPSASSVTAFGGTFLNADISGVTTTGSVTVTYFNGSTVLDTQTLTNDTSSSFFGYVGTQAITSVVLTDTSSNTWISASNVYTGAATPAPEPATLAGLGIAGLALLRKRRAR